jgi:acyl-CoA thioester hydrolase
MIVSETTIRVRYADTDQMKMAYYGRYFEYFEQSRSDLLRKMGLPYPEIERLGFYLPVIEAHANYMKPARYDDSLIVTAIVKDSPMARIRIDYEVRGESDRELLATGHTVHSFVNASSGRPTRAPEQFLEKFTSANSGS